MQKDERSISEIMENIRRMGDCIIASYGYNSWKDMPAMKKAEHEKLDLNLDI